MRHQRPNERLDSQWVNYWTVGINKDGGIMPVPRFYTSFEYYVGKVRCYRTHNDSFTEICKNNNCILLLVDTEQIGCDTRGFRKITNELSIVNRMVVARKIEACQWIIDIIKSGHKLP